jgi:hypothetical protein
MGLNDGNAAAQADSRMDLRAAWTYAVWKLIWLKKYGRRDV